jgi:polysaccharide pyruvyl transferase WcaK-like protein
LRQDNAANQPLRFLLVGYYGLGLVGDEAVLAVMTREFRERWHGCNITATCVNAGETERHFNIKTVSLYNLSAVLNEARKSDLVVIGGGGVFNEYSPFASIDTISDPPPFNALCSSLPAFCRAHGVPSVIFMAGVEPLYSEGARQAVADCFTLATRACVRDTASEAILSSIGIHGVELTCDAAVGIRPAELDRKSTLSELGLDPSKPVLTLSLRHWDPLPQRLSNDPQQWESEVATALRLFAERFDAQLLAVPHHLQPGWGYSDDKPLYRRIFEQTGNVPYVIWEGSLRPETIAAITGFGDIHLAMRHHGVVLAGATNTPCAAIAYSDKVRGAMSMVGLEEFCLDIVQTTSARVYDLLSRLWNQRALQRSRLTQGTESRRRRLNRSIDIAEEALNAPELGGGAVERALALWTEMVARESPGARVSAALAELLDIAINSRAADSSLLRVIRELSAIWPADGRLAYYHGFLELLANENLDAAESALTTAIRSGPIPAWALTVRAELHIRRGKLDSARADLDTAADLDPSLTRVKMIRDILSDCEARLSSPEGLISFPLN